MTVDDADALSSYNEFCSRLYALMESVVPKLVKSTNIRSRPPAPWWNSICEKSVIASYNALKLHRDDPTVDNYINYKRLDALKKRTFLEQKRLVGTISFQ